MADRLAVSSLPQLGPADLPADLDQVRRHVASGPAGGGGDFLPSVRQVALEIEVNPMTVSKAYSLLGARRGGRAGPRAGHARRRAQRRGRRRAAAPAAGDS